MRNSMLCCNSIFYFTNYQGLYSCVSAKIKPPIHLEPAVSFFLSAFSSIFKNEYYCKKVKTMKILYLSFDIAKVSKISESCKLFSIILYFFNVI